MSHIIDLKGNVTLITGASQGIGAQIARTFHAAGAMVVLNHPGIGSTGSDAQLIADELNAKRLGSASAHRQCCGCAGRANDDGKCETGTRRSRFSHQQRRNPA